jgi:DNA-binding response OmpR family regulator
MITRFVAVCVEDDDDARLLLRHVVGGLGGVLIETANVEDGMSAIERHNPHLVLLDLALPGQSGWRVVDQMRADHQMQGTPIVVVSIRDQAEEEYRGRHVDWVQDYITKPFGMAELEASLKKVLGL